MPLSVSTSHSLYSDFIRLLGVFLHVNREAIVLDNALSEESDEFRFIRGACFVNIKDLPWQRLLQCAYLSPSTSHSVPVSLPHASTHPASLPPPWVSVIPRPSLQLSLHIEYHRFRSLVCA